MSLKTNAFWLADYVDQDQRWIGQDGRVVLVDDMGPRWQEAALRYLRTHAEGLHHAVETRLVLELLPDDVDAERALCAHQAVAPAVWLEDTPIVRRLATLATRRRFLRHPRRWWR